MSLITATTSPSEELATRRISTSDFGLLGLRILVSVSMLYYQSWRQALQAWEFVWEKSPWAIADEVEKLGLPQPSMISVTLVFLLLAAPFGILIGFITRFNALVFLIALVFVLVTHLDDTLSVTLNAQTLVLYMGTALILSLSGGGLLSLDGLMTRRRHAKKKR